MDRVRNTGPGFGEDLAPITSELSQMSIVSVDVGPPRRESAFGELAGGLS